MRAEPKATVSGSAESSRTPICNAPIGNNSTQENLVTLATASSPALSIHDDGSSRRVCRQKAPDAASNTRVIATSEVASGAWARKFGHSA